MRREGRQHGWVCAYDRAMVDPEGKRPGRAVHAVEASAIANGGFVRAPRKPTNHSKPTGGRALRELSGKAAGAGSGKGRCKFKHDELKMWYLDGADHGRQLGRYDDMD